MKCATSWTKIRGNSARVQSRAIRRWRRNDAACTGPRRSRNARTTSTRTGAPVNGGMRRTTAAVRGSRERNNGVDTTPRVPRGGESPQKGKWLEWDGKPGKDAPTNGGLFAETSPLFRGYEVIRSLIRFLGHG